MEYFATCKEGHVRVIKVGIENGKLCYLEVFD